MNILDKIIESKKIEVQQRKQNCPVAELETSMFFNRQTYSLKKFINDPVKSGIIAEFKKKSPSRGIINDKMLPALVTKAYENAGASAVSVLTDQEYFGGSSKDLIEARTVLSCPILRKDFMIDEYQIVEAKSIGADAILLIAACLEPQKLKALADFAKFLGLEVLMEVHNKEELLKNLHDNIDVIGVNNRNLKDFSESINNSLELADLIPDKYVKISESSLRSAEVILQLKDKGYKGFLIGETFMKTEDPGKAIEKLVLEIKTESLKRKA